MKLKLKTGTYLAESFKREGDIEISRTSYEGDFTGMHLDGDEIRHMFSVPVNDYPKAIKRFNLGMNMPEEIRYALKKSDLDKHATAEFVLIEIGQPKFTQKSASFELRWMIKAA